MGKMLKFLLTILLLLMVSESAMAFMPPSFLTLVSSSIGCGVWCLFVLMSVNLILIFKFTKRAFKKKIIIFFAIIFVILVFNRWQEVRGLNSPVSGPGGQLEIDLNTITNKEIKNYRIFVAPRSIHKTLKIKKSESLYSLSLEDLMRLFVDKTKFDEFVLEYKISKADKLLFLCESGGMSRVLASLFAEYGYHAYFARFHLMNNNKSDLISAEFIKENIFSSELVVLPYDLRDRAKKDIYFSFDFTDDKKFFGLSEGIRNEIKIVPHEEFKAEMVQKNNIICSVNLHEMLTKYLLDDRGVEKANLYKLPIFP